MAYNSILYKVRIHSLGMAWFAAQSQRRASSEFLCFSSFTIGFDLCWFCGRSSPALRASSLCGRPQQERWTFSVRRRVRLSWLRRCGSNPGWWGSCCRSWPGSRIAGRQWPGERKGFTFTWHVHTPWGRAWQFGTFAFFEKIILLCLELTKSGFDLTQFNSK